MVTPQKILEYRKTIYNCARDFRHDANFMMNELALEFSFKIQPSISFPREVYRHYNNKGTFKENWSFYFHGSHCRFEHLTTGQVLEVLFTYSPEFGYISPFFFYVYIKTTEKYKWLGEVLTEDDIDKAIELLIKEGSLTEIKNTIERNLIIAI